MRISIGVFYFNFVSFASPLELVFHRTLWTALLLVISTTFYCKWTEFNSLVRHYGEMRGPNLNDYHPDKN